MAVYDARQGFTEMEIVSLGFAVLVVLAGPIGSPETPGVSLPLPSDHLTAGPEFVGIKENCHD